MSNLYRITHNWVKTYWSVRGFSVRTLNLRFLFFVHFQLILYLNRFPIGNKRVPFLGQNLFFCLCMFWYILWANCVFVIVCLSLFLCVSEAITEKLMIRNITVCVCVCRSKMTQKWKQGVVFSKSKRDLHSLCKRWFRYSFCVFLLIMKWKRCW